MNPNDNIGHADSNYTVKLRKIKYKKDDSQITQEAERLHNAKYLKARNYLQSLKTNAKDSAIEQNPI